MISNSLNILSISSYNHIIFSGVVMCWCREVREREKKEGRKGIQAAMGVLLVLVLKLN